MKSVKTKSTTKTLYLLLLLVLLVIIASFSASAYDHDSIVTLPYTGSAGENCTFHWYADGTVVISGTGEIDRFLSNRPYWYTIPGENGYYPLPNTHLVISEGITGIGNEQFHRCDFESILIPESLTSIGNDAFRECHALTSVTIPGNVIDIGTDAFRSCDGLTSVTISGSEISIGAEAFCNCPNLTSIAFGSDAEFIGESAFYDTGFYNDRNNWDENALYLGGWLLEVDETAEGTFTVKSEAKGICSGAASGCTGLTSVAIPDSVTSIGVHTFSGCTGLTSVIIPKSMKIIGGFAFENCSALNFVYYCGNSHDWDQIEIDQTDLTSIGWGISNHELLEATRVYNYSVHFHSYTSAVTTPATCKTEGVMTYTCTCGDSYTKDIPIDPNTHADLNENGDCPRCGKHIKDVEKPTEGSNEKPAEEKPTENLNIFQRIIQWFRNLIDMLFGWL